MRDLLRAACFLTVFATAAAADDCYCGTDVTMVWFTSGNPAEVELMEEYLWAYQSCKPGPEGDIIALVELIIDPADPRLATYALDADGNQMIFVGSENRWERYDLLTTSIAAECGFVS